MSRNGYRQPHRLPIKMHPVLTFNFGNKTRNPHAIASNKTQIPQSIRISNSVSLKFTYYEVSGKATRDWIIYIIKGDMFVCLYLCSVWPAKRLGRSRPNLTHALMSIVHPGSVSGKVNVKVINVCVREWQKYETPGMRHLANGAHTTFGRRRRRHLANDYETPSNYSSSNEARRRRRRAASAAGGSRTPSGGRVLTASWRSDYTLNTLLHYFVNITIQKLTLIFHTVDTRQFCAISVHCISQWLRASRWCAQCSS